MKKVNVLISVLLSISASFGYTTFDISQSLAPGSSNALGLAVNPDNSHTFISTLSYSGQDNLYEFDSSGNLVNSSRVNYGIISPGDIGSMVIGNNENIFMKASTGQGDTFILETSLDGQSIYSSLPNPYAYGISFDTITENLFYVEYISPRNYRINEINTIGNLVSQFNLNEPIAGLDWYRGLIYDSTTEDLFVNEYRSNILNKYSKNGQGEYEYSISYDINTLPLKGRIQDIDINRATGLFYAQDNNEQVIAFSLNELDVYTPIPEPTTISLLALGAFLAGRRRK